MPNNEDIFQEILFPNHDFGKKLIGVIAETVGREIISGVLAPGDFVNSVNLAKRFKTSRTPVREALMLLEKEGLVVIPPRRRPQVASVSLKEVLEIYRIRELLLMDATDQVIETCTDEDLAALVAIWELMDDACRRKAMDQAFRALVQFNDQLVELSGNVALKKILYSLRLKTLRVRYAIFSEPGQAERIADLHGQLVRALMERNAPLAKGLIQTVMRQPSSMLAAGELKLLAEHGEARPPRPRARKRPAA